MEEVLSKALTAAPALVILVFFVIKFFSVQDKKDEASAAERKAMMDEARAERDVMYRQLHTEAERNREVQVQTSETIRSLETYLRNQTP